MRLATIRRPQSLRRRATPALRRPASQTSIPSLKQIPILYGAAGISTVSVIGISIFLWNRKIEPASGEDAEESSQNVILGLAQTLITTASQEIPEPPPDVAISKEAAESNSTFVSSGLSFLRSSLPIDTVSSVLTSWTWPSSLLAWQSKVSALMLEYSLGPGSLYDQVVNSPPDLSVNPECEWDAQVRLGDELCLPERAFLRQRKRRMKAVFAKLMEVNERDVDEEDIPVVAFACSGGGYRAMCNTAGSLLAAKQTGLLDVATYISGISGSCWALSILYCGISGEEPSISALISHMRQRITKTYLDASTLDLLTTPPTNRYLLSGLMRKASQPGSDVSLVDIYGTLLSSRLFVPADTDRLNPRHLSLHRFRRMLDGDARMPLPILTCVMHDIPPPVKEVRETRGMEVDEEMALRREKTEDVLETLSSWLWFEWTPYEIGCDELGAWIPSWSLGRRFDKGKNIERRPELSLTIITGIVSSAFCATLHDYFNEMQPLLRTLPSTLYNWLADVVSERKTTMVMTHAILPDELPNFVKNLGGLREGSPAGISDRETIGLMDAGALINVPYYPLLRRNVDCIISLDASADSQDLHFQRMEEYALKRGLNTWPKGARWPAAIREGSITTDVGSSTSGSGSSRRPAEAGEEELAGQAVKQTSTDKRRMPAKPSTAAASGSQTTTTSTSTSSRGEAANRKLAEVQESELSGQTARQGDAEAKALPTASPRSTRTDLPASTSPSAPVPPPIAGCTVWIGSTSMGSATSRVEDFDEKHLAEKDGIGVVYIPQSPNDKVPDFDPLTVSTFRLEVSPEDMDKLLRLGQANFEDGADKIVKLLRVMWLRNKRSRLQRLAAERRFDEDGRD